MVDTATINYSLNKMTTIINQIAPSIQQVSEKYVQFVVMRAIIDPIFSFIGLMCCGLIYIPIHKYGTKKDCCGDSNFGSPSYLLPTVILSFFGMIFGCAFFIGVYNLILAITNPEMFTIQSIINSTKK